MTIGTTPPPMMRLIPDDVIDDIMISPSAKLVYWYLKRHYGKATFQEMALAMENDTEIMRKCFADLIRAGWVSLVTSEVRSDDFVHVKVHDIRLISVRQFRSTPATEVSP